jgi:hypothetical protein
MPEAQAQEFATDFAEQRLDFILDNDSDNDLASEANDAVSYFDRPAFYEDHDAEIAAHDAVVYNYGWVQDDTGIASKTSKGVLSTEVDAQGVVTHEWSSDEDAGFLTEPVPASFPEVPEVPADADDMF